MLKNKNIPEIRYKNTEDGWRLVKLSDLMSFSNGINAAKESYGRGRKMISVMDILSEERIVYEKIRSSVKVEENIESRNKVEKGDLIFVRSSEVRNEVGWASAYQQEQYALHSGFTIRGKKINEYDAKFIEYSLNSRNRHQIESKAGGSTRYNVGQEILKSVEIYIPSLEEQLQISTLVQNIENKIILNMKELKALKQTKQGFLQKMFPKDGKSMPEIRFPVFNDEWKLKKLKEIAEINPKSTLPSEFEYVDLGSVVGTRLLSSRKETKQTAPSRAQRVAKTGDVFYQTVRPYQQNNFLFDLTSDNFVFSTGYAQIRPNIDSYFLLNSLQVKSFVVAVMNSCTGTSYPAINSSDLSQLEIMVPVTGEEQIKIGEFFRQLDEVIELKEKELDALKETKKGFLQKMFV